MKEKTFEEKLKEEVLKKIVDDIEKTYDVIDNTWLKKGINLTIKLYTERVREGIGDVMNDYISSRDVCDFIVELKKELGI